MAGITGNRLTERCRGQCRHHARWQARKRKTPVPPLGRIPASSLRPRRRCARSGVPGLSRRRARHHHPGWLPWIRSARASCREMVTIGARGQARHRLAAPAEESPRSAGHRGRHHVVDGGVVGAGRLPDALQVARHQDEQAVGSNGCVDAGARGGLIGEDLAPRRQRSRRRPQRPGPMAEAAASSRPHRRTVSRTSAREVGRGRGCHGGTIGSGASASVSSRSPNAAAAAAPAAATLCSLR